MRDNTRDSGGSFFSRWSRRKADERAGKPLAEPQAPAKPLQGLDSLAPAQTLSPLQPLTPFADQAAQASPTETPEPVKLPTLEDTQKLTPQSDFKPFMAQGVTPDVKNAAMKKLFADPHFNVMDRMDTYIDDYSLPDPLPESMLRKMASAKFLKLFDDDDENKEKAAAPAVIEAAAAQESPLPERDDPDSPLAQDVAQFTPKLEALKIHDHTDLRLQPDHALEPKGTGRGAA
jgi:Protein of unknown function (DUF3306)